MKNLILFLLGVLCPLFVFGQLLTTEVKLKNLNAVGTDFFFDVYLRRASAATHGDIYPGAGNFAITFNPSEFQNPTISAIDSANFGTGYCTFRPTDPGPGNINVLFTRSNYFSGSNPVISGNKFLIGLELQEADDERDFNELIAKVDNASSHRLGRFKVSGIDPNASSINLTWNTSGGMEVSTRVQSAYLDANNEVQQQPTTILAINPDEFVLPIQLISFQGRAVQNTEVALEWKTAYEIENRGFEIERKEVDGSWILLDFVESQGDGHETKIYHYTDENPLIGENFYRLKQLDLDGTVSYSQIVNVPINGSKTLTVYPNPAGNILNINGLDGVESFEVVDSRGKTWLVGDTSEKSLSISALPPGLYIVRLDDKSLKFTKI